MTTICWDGTTLAADKRATNGGLIFTVTKIFRVRGCLVSAAGDFDRIMESIAWFADGADPAKLPPHHRSNDDYVGLLVIWPNGLIEKYERGPVPYKIESPFFAVGSGRDFAMAAMHLGKTAVEAVEVAMALDAGTGNGIDTLTLEIAKP
jgi:20S proteasome alpha/beta subunit